MSTVEAMTAYEQVVVGNDPEVGLRAIIAVHSTALGPALGGTRFVAYADENAALTDALDLARAMTYKNALAGLPHGGGKGVIVGDPKTERSDALLTAYGRLVASLQGRYVTACDVGTYVADMEVIARVNPWTTGRSARNGGAGDSGDLTSVGVHHSLRAIAEHLWGAPSLAGRRVGIVGVGKVGARLAGHVLDEGGRVLVADSDPAAIERLVAARPDVEVAADGDAVLLADVDVVSPCALGGVLTADVVGSMQAVAVCGGANNQLADDTQAAALAARGIVYAPDFLVNAGGVVAVGAEYAGRGHYDDAAARERASRIGATLLDVLRRADAAGTTPLDAAEALAEERIAAAEPRASFEPFPA